VAKPNFKRLLYARVDLNGHNFDASAQTGRNRPESGRIQR
jgi:hypothetical protein